MPAGSTVSKSGGNYFINSPAGLLISAGGTTISAGAGTIQLGSTLDKLNVASLNVTTPDATASMTNFSSETNRTTGSTFMKADLVDINLTNGHISMTNGSMARDADGLLAITAANMLYQKDGNNGSLDNFNLTSTKSGGISTLHGSAANVNLDLKGTLITAQNFDMQMVHGDATHPDTAVITGTNVDLVNGSNHVQAATATLNVITNADGSSVITANSNDLKWQDGTRSLSTAGATSITINQDASGTVRQLHANSADLTFNDPRGVLKAGNGSLTVNYGADGKLSGVSGAADTLNFTGPDGTLQANGGKLDLAYGSNGLLQSATGHADKLDFSNTSGQLKAAGGNLAILYGADGQPTSLHADADSLSWINAGGKGTVDLTGGKLDMTYGPGGVLQQARASVDTGTFTGSFGTLDLKSGGALTMNYGPDGKLTGFQGQVGQLDYAGDKGTLDLKGGTVSGQYNADGTLKGLQLHGDAATFNGVTSNGKSTSVNINNFNGTMTTGADGSRTFNFDSKHGSVAFDGRQVAFDQVKQLQIATDSTGAIKSVDLNLAGNTWYSQDGGDLQAIVKNAEGHYVKEGNKLTLSFDELAVASLKQGITANVKGASAELNDKFLKVHVDSAELAKTLGDQLNVKVENVDLLVNKTDAGGLKDAELQLGSLSGKVKGYDITATTKDGQRIRLTVQASPDGTMITGASLIIPSGGEVKISNEDLAVTLGKQQISFTQDGKGLYELKDVGLNANVVTKDAKVDVTGGTADVTLDANSGALTIKEISGTHVHVDIQGRTADIDLTRIKNLMVKATGISGESKGMMIQLVPNGDGSELTAKVSARVNGFPITLTLDNLAALDALFTYRQNELHAYAADPTHRGRIDVGVGPLHLEGSAIEVVARYNPYLDQRLLATMSRWLSTRGTKISAHTSIEADGTLRISSEKPGLYGELAVMMPNNSRMAPGQRWSGVGSNLDMGPSVIGSVGVRGETRKGTKITGAIFAGAVSGSYVTWDQRQGSATVYGVPIPNTMDFPTTAVAGVRVGVENSKHHGIDLVAGGYVNPAGFVPQDGKIPLSEASKYGGLAGVHYHEENFDVGLDGTLAVLPNKKLDPGVRVSTEVVF